MGRPQLTLHELESQSYRLFSPILYPRAPDRPPHPPSLAASRLPPPCAEADERSRWRIRRFKLWRDYAPALRLAVLDQRRRGQLRRWQTFAIPSNPAVVRGTIRHEFPLGPQGGSHRFGGPPTVSHSPSSPLPMRSSPPSESEMLPRSFTPDSAAERPTVYPPNVYPPNVCPPNVYPPKLTDPTPAQPKSPTMPPQKETMPTKLSRDERHRRRERMKQHRWVLDVEHERRFRTGMWLLMEEVLEFQEEFTVDEDNRVRWLPDVDVDRVAAYTKLFKLIRESSDHLLTNLEIPLVAGRKAAARAVREDERERKQRKDERRRKREGKEAKREGRVSGMVKEGSANERGDVMQRSGSGAGGDDVPATRSDGALATTRDRGTQGTKKKSVTSSLKSATAESATAESATAESKSRSRKSESAKTAEVAASSDRETGPSVHSPISSSKSKTKHQQRTSTSTCISTSTGTSTSTGSVTSYSDLPPTPAPLADAATVKSKTTLSAPASPTPHSPPSPRSPRSGSPDNHSPAAGLEETNLSSNTWGPSLAAKPSPSEETVSDQLASLLRRLVQLQIRREELVKLERNLLEERPSLETPAPAPRIARASRDDHALHELPLRRSSSPGSRASNRNPDRPELEEDTSVPRGMSSLSRIEEHESELSEETDHDGDVVDDVDDNDDVDDVQGGDGVDGFDDRDDPAGSTEPGDESEVPTSTAHPLRTVSGWTGDLNRDADTAIPRSTLVLATEPEPTDHPYPSEYSSDSSAESLDVATPTSPTHWRGVLDIGGTEEGSVADTCTLSAWDAEPVAAQHSVEPHVHAVLGKASVDSDATWL